MLDLDCYSQMSGESEESNNMRTLQIVEQESNNNEDKNELNVSILKNDHNSSSLSSDDGVDNNNNNNNYNNDNTSDDDDNDDDDEFVNTSERSNNLKISTSKYFERRFGSFTSNNNLSQSTVGSNKSIRNLRGLSRGESVRVKMKSWYDTRSNRSLIKKVDNFFNTGRVLDIRKLCRLLVTNRTFRLVIVGMIAVNGIMMGISTYYFDNDQVYAIFDTFDYIFLVLFTIELAIQFMAYLLRFFLDGWLVFDLTIISLSWFAVDDAQILRVFRIFRALRLITRIRAVKQVVTAILSVMSSMVGILLLLFLIYYIFAVMLTELFRDIRDTEQPYFHDLFYSFFTLFEIMTFDAWGSISREIMVREPYAWILFIIYMATSGLIVVNFIVAVICDAVESARNKEKGSLQGQFNDGDGYSSDGSVIEGHEDDEDDEDKESMRLVRERMLCVEEQLDKFEQLQERTVQALQFLTGQFQDSDEQQETNNDVAAAGENNNDKEALIRYEKIDFFNADDEDDTKRYTLEELQSMNLSLRILCSGKKFNDMRHPQPPPGCPILVRRKQEEEKST